MKPKSILLIEDEPAIRETIEYNLEREGFRVASCGDGAAGLDRIRKERPDLVVLDLMLPGLDGVEICRQLRSDPDLRSTPVIMVTAKGEESDVVLGLGVGADDYVPKPFSPKELVARVHAVLRRGVPTEPPDGKGRIERDGVAIDPERHEVTVDGEPVPFTATEFRLLYFLASRPGRVFTRNELLTRVLGEDSFVIDRNIDVHIRAIRKKLGGRRDAIETIRGVGYRFRDVKSYVE